MPEESLVKSQPITRRNFLASSAAAASLLLVGNSTSSPVGRRPRHAILVDISKCIACMRCVAGCEAYHTEYEGLSAPGTAYTKVETVSASTNVPELCLHCFDSPCTNACVTHALTQLDYGAVVYDSDKCIGCLLCVNQCPFGSITFDPTEKKIRKCVMCSKAVEQGKTPYCVQVCPTGTRTFGLYEDKLAEGMKLAEQKQAVLLYPRDTGTLYVVPEKELQNLTSDSRVTVIKDGYPASSRLIGQLLKYSRLAWIPMILGTAFYFVKWRRRGSGTRP